MASLMRALKVAGPSIISRPRALAARAFSASMSKAVVYDQQGSLRVVNMPSVEVKENDVCVRMIAAPINPSDINRIEGVYPVRPEVPAVGGYEGVGMVHSVGSAVKDLSPGDLVIPSPLSLGTSQTYIVQDKSAWHKINTVETLANKVEALEEKLEEVKNFRNLEVRLTDINQRFSSMEGMMKQLLELHSRSAPVAETGLAIKDTDVDSKLQNLKMPIFEGEDVDGWVYRAEKYFDANGVTEDEKMVEVAGCLEGRAAAWYQLQEYRQAFRSWEEFKARLLGRFRDTQGGDLYDQSSETHGEYQQRSEFLAGLSEAEMEENFLRSLKADVRAVLLQLIQLKPQNFDQMIGLAEAIEDSFWANLLKTSTSSVSNSDEEQSGSNLKHVTKSEAHNKQANSKRRPREKKKLAQVAETGLAIKDVDVDSKLPSLKMTMFEGEDVHEWVYRAEKYFDANGVTEDEKMVEVAGCLEERAAMCYPQQEYRQAFRSWEEFKARLLGCRRGGTQDGDLHDQFFGLIHEGTLGEYQFRYEFLALLSDAQKKENFLRALKAEVREVLLQMKPQNLSEMVRLAELIDDMFRANQCKTGTSSVSNSDEEQSGSNLKHVTESEAHNKQANSKRRPRGKKKLAPEREPVARRRVLKY